jgi:surface protein
MEKDKTNECLSCNPGYFIPDDAEDKTKCVKCSLERCKICSGTVGNEKCIQCMNDPFMINGEIKTCSSCQIGLGENCLSCDKDNKCKTCNKGYKLVEGKCKLIENTFFAVYNSTSIDEPTKILCNVHTDLKLTDFQMYVNNHLVIPSIITIKTLPYIVYKFEYIGLHNVTLSFNTTLSDNIGWMFGQCENLVSIRFSKTFDTSFVTNIYNMFAEDYNLLSIDISSFDTSKVTDMSEVFYGCKSLKSLDLSTFDTSNVLRTKGMFEYCENLNYLDISSFNLAKVKNTLNMLSFVSKTGTIKINNLFDNFKNLIPQNWTIIN